MPLLPLSRAARIAAGHFKNPPNSSHVQFIRDLTEHHHPVSPSCTDSLPVDYSFSRRRKTTLKKLKPSLLFFLSFLESSSLRISFKTFSPSKRVNRLILIRLDINLMIELTHVHIGIRARISPRISEGMIERITMEYFFARARACVCMRA